MDKPKSYPADIAADTDGQWLVTFPDVPEAITSGHSYEAARKNAPDALETALEFYAETGRAFPKPSETGEGLVLVRLPARAKADGLLGDARRICPLAAKQKHDRPQHCALVELPLAFRTIGLRQIPSVFTMEQRHPLVPSSVVVQSLPESF